MTDDLDAKKDKPLSLMIQKRINRVIAKQNAASVAKKKTRTPHVQLNLVFKKYPLYIIYLHAHQSNTTTITCLSHQPHDSSYSPTSLPHSSFLNMALTSAFCTRIERTQPTCIPSITTCIRPLPLPLYLSLTLVVFLSVSFVFVLALTFAFGFRSFAIMKVIVLCTASSS